MTRVYFNSIVSVDADKALLAWLHPQGSQTGTKRCHTLFHLQAHQQASLQQQETVLVSGSYLAIGDPLIGGLGLRTPSQAGTIV